MSPSNVIPFRKRPPSEMELEAYRQMTRNWSEEVKQLMFPDHFMADMQKGQHKRSQAIWLIGKPSSFI